MKQSVFRRILPLATGLAVGMGVAMCADAAETLDPGCIVSGWPSENVFASTPSDPLPAPLLTGRMETPVTVTDVLEARYRISTESPVSWIDLLTDKVGFLLFLR